MCIYTNFDVDQKDNGIVLLEMNVIANTVNRGCWKVDVQTDTLVTYTLHNCYTCLFTYHRYVYKQDSRHAINYKTK